jgi:hypothetical protein
MDERTCSADGCTRPVNSVGLCQLHYNRRYGEIRKARAAPCSVDGCDGPEKARGLCGKHYWRLTRRGALVDPPNPGRRYVMSDGYTISTVEAGHPLAIGKRVEYGRVRVLEHRVVLYEAIGPGPHGCHWCGSQIDWLPAFASKELTVDHVNWDRADNSVTNLVPSCRPCNVKRQKSAATNEQPPSG